MNVLGIVLNRNLISTVLSLFAIAVIAVNCTFLDAIALQERNAQVGLEALLDFDDFAIRNE